MRLELCPPERKPAEPKEYERPRITVYGSIREITNLDNRGKGVNDGRTGGFNTL